MIIDREGMCCLKELQFFTDVYFKFAVIENCLEKIAMGVILWILHVEFICLRNTGTDYLPKRLKVR